MTEDQERQVEAEAIRISKGYEYEVQVEHAFTQGASFFDELDKWIDVNDMLPSDEGKYMVCNFYRQFASQEYNYSEYTSNFHFFKFRESKERIVDADGITGCFSDNAGYADTVTHWQPLPKPPNKKL